MTGLAFTAPWLLAALAAAALPVIAHLARRETRAGRPFPSLMFLERVPFPSRARRTLRDRALLALRLLALLALVLGFSGLHPTYGGSAAPPPERDSVVLLDVSYSMGTPGLFQAARERAGEVLDAVSSAERVALVIFDTVPRTASGLEEGVAAARLALATVQPGNGGTDLARALDGAGRLLADSPARLRRVVLISDLQASALTGSPRLREDVELELRPIAVPRPGNLALEAAWPDAGAGTNRTRLTVRVANTGGVQASGRLSVHVDGLAGEGRDLSLGPEARRQIPVTVFPAGDRPTRVHLALTADDLEADNHRYLVLAPRRGVDVLLVQASPPAGPHLTAALRLARDPEVRLAVRTAADAVAADVRGADVVILDGVAPETEAARAALEERVRAGRGLLALAAAADFPGLDALLPAPGASMDAGVRGTAFTALAPDHALAAKAGGVPGDGRAGATLAGVRVWRYRRTAVAARDRVLARFETGDPALIGRRVEEGQVLLLTTSPAPAWSALALDPVFVPLVLESVSFLARRAPVAVNQRPGDALDAAAHADAVAGGEGLAAALSAGAAMRVRSPQGRERTVPQGVPVVLDSAGFHELRAGDAPAVPVAVSVDARESLFAAASTEQLRARVVRTPAPARVSTGAGVGSPDPRLAHALLALAAGLLLLESLVAGRLTRRRSQSAPEEVIP